MRTRILETPPPAFNSTIVPAFDPAEFARLDTESAVPPSTCADAYARVLDGTSTLAEVELASIAGLLRALEGGWAA